MASLPPYEPSTRPVDHVAILHFLDKLGIVEKAEAELFDGTEPRFCNVVLDSLEVVMDFNRHRLAGTLSEFRSSFGNPMDENTFFKVMTILAREREKLINHLLRRRVAPSLCGLGWLLKTPEERKKGIEWVGDARNKRWLKTEAERRYRLELKEGSEQLMALF